MKKDKKIQINQINNEDLCRKIMLIKAKYSCFRESAEKIGEMTKKIYKYS